MRAGELFDSICQIPDGQNDIDIRHITDDSRDVCPHTLFIARSGIKSDGQQYIPLAIEAGAVMILSETESLCGIPVIVNSDIENIQWKLTNRLYDTPSEKLFMTGITGTNGKTTTSFLISQLLESFDICCARIGTIHHFTGARFIKSANTSPAPVLLQNILNESVNSGAEHMVMEVSSHALALGRVENITYNLAVFTNLTQDHLDFHHSMEDYFQQKRKLFEKLTGKGKAVINIDCVYGRRLYSEFSEYAVSIGESREADFCFSNPVFSTGYTDCILSIFRKPYNIRIPLPGKFNIYNTVLAIASLYCMGFSADDIIEHLPVLKSVKGRFEMIWENNRYVVVDYAHTPDGLQKIIESVRALPHKRIITVFGCGGDRDRKKRPIMGKIACSLSDYCIITSDNPRTEDPEIIIADIVPEEFSNYETITDRRKAIEQAIRMMNDGDVAIIAGKGHENYQIVGDRTLEFDDVAIAEEFLKQK